MLTSSSAGNSGHANRASLDCTKPLNSQPARFTTSQPPLALADMDRHALAIEVGNFEMAPFIAPEGRGVEGGEDRPVFEVAVCGRECRWLLRRSEWEVGWGGAWRGRSRRRTSSA
jgi:hypothetical protein